MSVCVSKLNYINYLIDSLWIMYSTYSCKSMFLFVYVFGQMWIWQKRGHEGRTCNNHWPENQEIFKLFFSLPRYCCHLVGEKPNWTQLSAWKCRTFSKMQMATVFHIRFNRNNFRALILRKRVFVLYFWTFNMQIHNIHISSCFKGSCKQLNWKVK